MNHAATSRPQKSNAAIRNVPDFPKPGIQFKDITPVLADARLFAGAIDLLCEDFKPGSVDAVVGIDARGFIFAAAAAMKLKRRFRARPQKRQVAATRRTSRITRSNTARRPSPCTLTRSNPARACC